MRLEEGSMPKFSQRSIDNLALCHPDLQRLFTEVVKHVDCIVIEGYRGQEKQHEAFVTGKSKLDWPNGKHNQLPSLAVDAMPFPIDWKDEKRIHYFIGFVLGVASQLGIQIRSGHDWDRDNDLDEHDFQDGPHFERVGP
jgi:peptidoglycan L-alanyl-D-glutamate endopeptidase CwlK